MQGEMWLVFARDFEEKKKHKRERMKVALNMHFNGRANSFQIGSSRWEFDAALIDSQTREVIRGDEKRNKGAR